MPDIKASGATREDREFIQEHRDELSESTLRARWVHDPGEMKGRDGETLATRSPDVIRAWADARDAVPVTVGEQRDRPRVLRMRFRGDGDNLEQISWDQWLEVFESRNLVFIFQNTTSDGSQSNFFRLDSPDRQDG